MGKLSEIQILVFINKVLLEHCHTHLGIVCNCLYISAESWVIASLYGFAHNSVKNLPAMQETRVWSLGWEDPLEKEMVTHSSILGWRIPWIESPGRLQSVGF